MPALSDKFGQPKNESVGIQVGAGEASELTNRARNRARRAGEICDIDRYAVFVERSRNRDNNSVDPTKNKNRPFQKVPCFFRQLNSEKHNDRAERGDVLT